MLINTRFKGLIKEKCALQTTKFEDFGEKSLEKELIKVRLRDLRLTDYSKKSQTFDHNFRIVSPCPMI